MSKSQIKLPNWVELNRLKEEERTTKRIDFILELVRFFDEKNRGKTGGWVDRVYFDRRGAYIYHLNRGRPWRYTARGMAQAKFELARIASTRSEAKEYLPHDAEAVKEVIEAYCRLGWGLGIGGRWRELSVRGGTFRFFNRGRWYSLKRENIHGMQSRARKAQLIMDFFHRQFSLKQIPADLLFLCLDVLKHVRILEETGEVRVELGKVRETFPATPNGVYAAWRRLHEATRAYLKAA